MLSYYNVYVTKNRGKSSRGNTTEKYCNLVPRVSLSPPPRAREERPWLGLVTYLLDKLEHKGGVL